MTVICHKCKTIVNGGGVLDFYALYADNEVRNEGFMSDMDNMPSGANTPSELDSYGVWVKVPKTEAKDEVPKARESTANTTEPLEEAVPFENEQASAQIEPLAQAEPLAQIEPLEEAAAQEKKSVDGIIEIDLSEVAVEEKDPAYDALDSGFMLSFDDEEAKSEGGADSVAKENAVPPPALDSTPDGEVSLDDFLGGDLGGAPPAGADKGAEEASLVPVASPAPASAIDLLPDGEISLDDFLGGTESAPPEPSAQTKKSAEVLPPAPSTDIAPAIDTLPDGEISLDDFLGDGGESAQLASPAAPSASQLPDGEISLDDFMGGGTKSAPHTDGEISLDDFLGAGASGMDSGGAPSIGGDISLDDFMGAGFSAAEEKKDEVPDEPPLEMDLSFDAPPLETVESDDIDIEIEDISDTETGGAKDTDSTESDDAASTFNMFSTGGGGDAEEMSDKPYDGLAFNIENVDLSDFGVDANAEETAVTSNVEENKGKLTVVDYDLTVSTDSDDIAAAPVVSEVPQGKGQVQDETKTEENDAALLAANDVLKQIASSLTSLQEEIKNIKREMAEMKEHGIASTAPAPLEVSPEEETEALAVADEVPVSESAEGITEEPVADAGGADSGGADSTAGGFFSEDEGDDAIALSGDELSSMMSNAVIDEAASEETPAVGAEESEAENAEKVPAAEESEEAPMLEDSTEEESAETPMPEESTEAKEPVAEDSTQAAGESAAEEPVAEESTIEESTEPVVESAEAEVPSAEATEAEEAAPESAEASFEEPAPVEAESIEEVPQEAETKEEEPTETAAEEEADAEEAETESEMPEAAATDEVPVAEGAESAAEEPVTETSGGESGEKESAASGGFFSDDEGDNAIALSGDELSNMMSNAVIDEGAAENTVAEGDMLGEGFEEAESEESLEDFSADFADETEGEVIEIVPENESEESKETEDFGKDFEEENAAEEGNAVNEESNGESLPEEISIPVESDQFVEPSVAAISENDESAAEDVTAEDEGTALVSVNDVGGEDAEEAKEETAEEEAAENVLIPNVNDVGGKEETKESAEAKLEEVPPEVPISDASGMIADGAAEELTASNLDYLNSDVPLDEEPPLDIAAEESEQAASDITEEEAGSAPEEVAESAEPVQEESTAEGESFEEESEPVLAEMAEEASESAAPALAEESVVAPVPVEESASEGKSTSSLPSDMQGEVKAVLMYMDELLESLPEDKIAEFARSEQFATYKKLFEELGLS